MNASSGSFMRESSPDELLDQLLVQIDRLWRDGADKAKVELLIHSHPEFSVQLQDFWADLMELDDPLDSEFQKAEDIVYEWVCNRGISEALSRAAEMRRQEPSPAMGPNLNRGEDEGKLLLNDQISQPSTERWLAFLGRRTGRKKVEVAAALPNVTLEFLSLVSRYPQSVPDPVKRALSRHVEERFGVPVEESLDHLSRTGSVVKRAASRREPSSGPPSDFEQLLERGALEPAAKLFWRECAQGKV